MEGRVAPEPVPPNLGSGNGRLGHIHMTWRRAVKAAEIGRARSSARFAILTLIARERR